MSQREIRTIGIVAKPHKAKAREVLRQLTPGCRRGTGRSHEPYSSLYRFQEVEVTTAKEEIRKMLDKLADDASFEDIQYHIYVRQKIERGLRDVEEGRVLDQEAVERRMAKWLGG